MVEINSHLLRFSAQSKILETNYTWILNDENVKQYECSSFQKI